MRSVDPQPMTAHDATAPASGAASIDPPPPGRAPVARSCIMTAYIARWAGALLALTLAGTAAGMTLTHPAPVAGTSPAQAEGARLYRTYCASCHGLSGRGDGPVADVMRRRPSDLTEIRRRYRGFPTDLMISIVDGRKPVRGHGSIEMPVWGDVFGTGSAQDEVAIRERIVALVQYLEGIQARNTH
jgi:hypothetical protein